MAKVYFKELHAHDDAELEYQESEYFKLPEPSFSEIERGHVLYFVLTNNGRVSIIYEEPLSNERGAIMILDPPLPLCYKKRLIQLFLQLFNYYERKIEEYDEDFALAQAEIEVHLSSDLKIEKIIKRKVPYNM